MSTPVTNNSPSDKGVRKRTRKACDRCRLKKSKCDGANPCARYRTDNVICVFGENKKVYNKVYPKGYIEMLEQQQKWLVNGLQEFYRRLLKNDGWQREPLECGPNQQPSTHDLLIQLGQDLWNQDIGPMQGRDSSDTSSKSASSPAMAAPSTDPFTAQTMPQTPATLSPPTTFRTDAPPSDIEDEPPQITPMNMYATTILMLGVVDPSELQSAHVLDPQWPSPGSGGYDDIDLMLAQYSVPSYNTTVPSSIFNRPMPMGSLIPGSYGNMNDKNDFEDIGQFLNT
ncbi:hypothetical protein ASPCADRAFT_400806 [Aspergillus carbonarius ITEM 5010]|uniref:Zn(2)-C6 fungal-type domain-containing protein n=1 Tax=Aspergillus carbonarius (strain ITEM 5010) TaxID=602072 RepID=A0A1R3R7H1_ASPC5|nr:hypothetical protein ASPCADRAFT_400806 [Aspergillus carbonarius ITEM 5010]